MAEVAAIELETGNQRRTTVLPGLPLAVAVLWLWGALPAATEPIVVLEQRPGEGERCLVCGVAIHDHEVVELRYRGRTFHVAAEMLAEFESDPERYFRDLEARSGLFDEAALTEAGDGAGYGWFALGLYVLLGLVSAAACGAIAVARNRPPWPWFFSGLFVNVLAVAVLWSRSRAATTSPTAAIPSGLRKVPTTREPIACPTCGAPAHPAARHCSRCHSSLAPSVRAETANV